MNYKDFLRYKKMGEIANELHCKFVGDFAGGNEATKNILNKNIIYKSFNFPEYDFEKPFKIREKIDCAIFSEVFEHLRNPRTFINSLSKSLQPKSKLILTTPNSGFIKNRINLLIGKTPETFFGPSAKEIIFTKNFDKISEEKKKELELQLHVRAYNYKELKKILELEGFQIIKRMKLKYPGIKGKILHTLPLNFQGGHFILAELKQKNK